MTESDLLAGGLVTVSQAARRLGIGRNTLYAWMRARKVPFTRINGVYRIPSNAVEEMLKHGLTLASDDEVPDHIRKDPEESMKRGNV